MSIFLKHWQAGNFADYVFYIGGLPLATPLARLASHTSRYVSVIDNRQWDGHGARVTIKDY